MSGVFRNIDPSPSSVQWVERGWGVNSDARHCSVLYIQGARGIDARFKIKIEMVIARKIGIAA